MAMATGTSADFWRSLLNPQPYKPGQGPWVRNGTLAASGALVLYGMYAWSSLQSTDQPFLKWGVPVLCGVVCGWILYRVVNFPRFADFMISTESEMNKVSWPGKQELYVSTGVVLVSTALLAAFMFVADQFWKWLLTAIGILKIGGLLGGGANSMADFSLFQVLASLIGSFL